MTLIFFIFAGLFAALVTGQGRQNIQQYLENTTDDDENGPIAEMNGSPAGGSIPYQMPSGMIRGRFPGSPGASPFQGPANPFTQNMPPFGSLGPNGRAGPQGGSFPSGASPFGGPQFGNGGSQNRANSFPFPSENDDDNSLFMGGGGISGGQGGFPPRGGPMGNFGGRNQNSPFPSMGQGQDNGFGNDPSGMNPFLSLPPGTSRIVTFPQMNPRGSSSTSNGGNFGQGSSQGPFFGQGGPQGNIMGQGSPFGQGAPQGSPFGQGGPSFGQDGSSFGQGGPSFGQGSPSFGQGGPSFGQGGPSFGQGGSPFQQGGSSLGFPFPQGGSNFGQGGFQGSPFGQGGSSNDFQDSPFDQQGGLPNIGFGQGGSPNSAQGSPFGGFNSRNPQGISFSRGRPNANDDDFSSSLSGGQRSLGGMRPFSLARPDNEGNTNPYIPGFGFVKGINGMGQRNPFSSQGVNSNSLGGQSPDNDLSQNGIADGQSDIGGPSCPNKMGMYGDVPSGCSIYYMCQRDGRTDTYPCPVTTKFNNKLGVCDYATNVDENCNPLNGSNDQAQRRRNIKPSSLKKEIKSKDLTKTKTDLKKKSDDQ